MITAPRESKIDVTVSIIVKWRKARRGGIKVNRNNPYNAYKETSIKTASRGKLVLMLYDGAIKQIDIAHDLLEKKSKHYDKINNSIIKAQDIVTELMVSLDFEKGGEIAKNLFSLYMFFNQQLVQANISKDAELLKKIRDMLAELRETWVEVFNKIGKENTSGGMGGVNIAG